MSGSVAGGRLERVERGPARPSRRSRGRCVAIPTAWAFVASAASRSGGVMKTPRSVPAGSGLPSSASIGSRSAAVRDASVPSAKSFNQPRWARRASGQSGSPLRSPAAAAASICSSRMQAWTRIGSVAALVERPERGDPGAQALLERQPARIVDGDDAQADEVAGELPDQRLVALERRRRHVAGHEPGRRFVEDAARLAGVVATDEAAVRVDACRASIAAVASAARLTQSEWWSWAQIATCRPGTTASRSSAVGQRPNRSGSQPWPSIQRSPSGRASPRRPDRGEGRRERRDLRQVDLVAGDAALGEVEMGVGQARDRDLVGVQLEPDGERVGPRLELDRRAGERDATAADPDRLDPAEAGDRPRAWRSDR